MADSELEEIRKARLAQLQQQSAGGRSSGGDDEQRRQEAAEARTSVLNQILEPEAADRLGRIRLVKESRATEVENRLIQLARSGQLRSKVTDAQLKDLLGAAAQSTRDNDASENVVFTRRKGTWDDDDDDLENL